MDLMKYWNRGLLSLRAYGLKCFGNKKYLFSSVCQPSIDWKYSWTRTRLSRSRSFRTVYFPNCKSKLLSSHFIVKANTLSFQTFTNKMAVVLDTAKEIRLQFHGSVSQNGTDVDQVQNTELTAAFDQAIKAGSQCLLNGGVLGVPTDTIYGIAGLAQNNKAVNRIYDIKKRNYEKPVAISVGTIDDIYIWSKVTVPCELLNDLLPGPVTVVFERSPQLNPELNPHTNLVGIRIPDHAFMKDLAVECKSPIALTSANVSGDKSCLQIEEFRHLWPLLDLVVNGGKLNDSEECRLGSTVVDLSVEGTYRIIRPGSAHTATCAVLQDKYKLKERSRT